MIELILLIPVMIIGLAFYLLIDASKIAMNERENTLSATEQAERQLIDEMKEKIILFYGTETIIKKKLISYDDYFKEIKTIEEKLKNYDNKRGTENE